MQINVAQLLKENIGAIRRFALDDTVCLDEAMDCHIQGDVELLRTKRGILVRGAFTGMSHLVCSRCLTPFEQTLAFSMEEEFLPSVSIDSGTPVPQEEDPCSFVTDEYHIMDLSEAIRQYGLLALPMKPVCRPDCAGLCPHCGANLNQNVCDCTPRSGGMPQNELTKLNDLARKLR